MYYEPGIDYFISRGYLNPRSLYYNKIRNPYTLNIFTDGSVNKTGKYYAVLAITVDEENNNQDKVLVSICNAVEVTDGINIAELKAIIYALSIAIDLGNDYHNINIFTDSLFCIENIRKYILNKHLNRFPYDTSTYMNILTILYDLYNKFEAKYGNSKILSIYHINSHIGSFHNGEYRDLDYAKYNFLRNNYIEQTESELVAYAAKNNNKVDDMFKDKNELKKKKEVIYPVVKIKIDNMIFDKNRIIKKKRRKKNV